MKKLYLVFDDEDGEFVGSAHGYNAVQPIIQEFLDNNYELEVHDTINFVVHESASFQIVRMEKETHLKTIFTKEEDSE